MTALARANVVGVDAKRCPAPVDMRVEIDQAGRHDAAGHVSVSRGRKSVADRGDLAVGEGDVGDPVDPLRGVDHAAIL